MEWERVNSIKNDPMVSGRSNEVLPSTKRGPWREEQASLSQEVLQPSA